MKKNGVLNSEIANVLARMGHTDYIVIADCGLPIPDETKRIDLALTKGVPSFLEVLTTILDDFVVEKAILALEIKTNNGELLKEIERSGYLNNMEYVTHEELKILTKKAKAVIRTGECSPYANIILHSGVIF
ncbi:D-ribose pyranase [Heyndrickxia sp. MSNUG]|uniref:D-ribose pyranase n=1 Tax=Heyndrickxia sp. MSNUG TaxID=3136677 RepID=UPI003C2BD0F2